VATFGEYLTSISPTSGVPKGSQWSVMLVGLLGVVVDELPDAGLDELDLGEDLFGGGGPGEGLGVGVPCSM
jgi:hypothetical protein